MSKKAGGGEKEGGGRQKRAAALKPRQEVADFFKPKGPQLNPVRKFVGSVPSQYLPDNEVAATMKQRELMIQALVEAEAKPNRGSIKDAMELQKMSPESVHEERDGSYRPTVAMCQTMINQNMAALKKHTGPQRSTNVQCTKDQFEKAWADLKKSPQYKVYRCWPVLEISTEELRCNSSLKQDPQGNEVILDRNNRIFGGFENFRALEINPNGDCALHCLAKGLLNVDNGGPIFRFLLLFFLGENVNKLATMPDYLQLAGAEGDVYTLFGTLCWSKGHVPFSAFALAAQYIPDLCISMTTLRKERLATIGYEGHTVERVFLHRDRPMATTKKILHILYIDQGFTCTSPVDTPYYMNHFVLMVGDEGAPTQEEILRKWRPNPPTPTYEARLTDDEILARADPGVRDNYLVSERKKGTVILVINCS